MASLPKFQQLPASSMAQNPGAPDLPQFAQFSAGGINYSQLKCSVWQNAAQNGVGTGTKILFDTVEYDPTGMFFSSVQAIRCPAPGPYRAFWRCGALANTDVKFSLYRSRNAVTTLLKSGAESVGGAGNNSANGGACFVVMQATDLLFIQIEFAAALINVTTGQVASYFMVEYAI